MYFHRTLDCSDIPTILMGKSQAVTASESYLFIGIYIFSANNSILTDLKIYTYREVLRYYFFCEKRGSLGTKLIHNVVCSTT